MAVSQKHEEHPLEHEYTIWFGWKNKNNNFKASMDKVGNFKTVEGFWELYRSASLNMGCFFWINIQNSTYPKYHYVIQLDNKNEDILNYAVFCNTVKVQYTF